MTELLADDTRLIKQFGGTCVVFAVCEKCNKYMQYPADKPYLFCPYCKRRVVYEEEE